MRELHLSAKESTPTFFVLYDEDGVRFKLARSEMQLPGSTLHVVGDNPPTPTDEATASTPQLANEEVTEASTTRSLPEPDPLYATALTLRPNQIQARIRAGATAAQLAEEMGVAESRVEPYAHPVLLERSQIAEAAKQSHPVREDGPAKLTLFEILASSFAARGHSISDATWDATREPGDAWVVHVRWSAGLTENEATWSYTRRMGAAATTEARNAIAADLTDPNFAQPVRSLTAVDRRSAHSYDEPELEVDDANRQHTAAGEDRSGRSPGARSDDTLTEGDVLRHPDENDRPQKRRRKAVTPHWEDVLLGVRTSTKRPRK